MKRPLFFCFLTLLLCMLLQSAAAGQMGTVNHDGVRFRRKAESTDVWAMLDSGWQVKPSLDLRVTPHAGDINARGDVRFTGVGGSATMETQTMDYVTYGGTAGLEFGKDNIKMGLNYNLEAGAHSTQHGVFATFRYEF